MELEHFVDQLLAEKGIESELPEVQAELKADVLDRVENRVNARILELLPEASLSEFETKMDSGSEKEIQEFLRSTIADFDEQIALELLSFRAAYLG